MYSAKELALINALGFGYLVDQTLYGDEGLVPVSRELALNYVS